MKVTPNDVTDDGDGRGFIPSETAPGRCGIAVWHHEEPVRSRSLIPRHGQPRQLLSIPDDKSGGILPPIFTWFLPLPASCLCIGPANLETCSCGDIDDQVLLKNEVGLTASA